MENLAQGASDNRAAGLCCRLQEDASRVQEFFYTPLGGSGETAVGSNMRLPADTYELQASPETALWRQIWVTKGANIGDVSARGIKFHFAGSKPADWTEGCFILSTAYKRNGNTINYNFTESRVATVSMDLHRGARSIYLYFLEKYNGAGRIGAKFANTVLLRKLVLKDGF